MLHFALVEKKQQLLMEYHACVFASIPASRARTSHSDTSGPASCARALQGRIPHQSTCMCVRKHPGISCQDLAQRYLRPGILCQGAAGAHPASEYYGVVHASQRCHLPGISCQGAGGPSSIAGYVVKCAVALM